MKKVLNYLFVLLIFFAVNGMVSGQNNPIDFESGGFGATWSWTVFENATNPAVEIIPNPYMSGANTSATVAKFTALQTGNPWAGCETLHGSDIGTFTLDSTNSTIKIMVWKPVISDVGIKFVLPSSEALPEIKVTNTLTNQWEELTFDFSGRIGHPATIGQDQIVIFPDFNLAGRTQDNVCYFDNIRFSPIIQSPGPTVGAPVPTINPSNVISIFSDTFTNVVGTNLNPNWQQNTQVSQLLIGGNNTLKYVNLNYQGIELGSSQNLTAAGMQYLHLDFWNLNSNDLGVFLISPGPVETRVSLVPPGTNETWISVDIPLAAFAPVNLADVFQFKFNGNGTIYLDNIYFSSVVSEVKEFENSFPSEYTLEQNYPNPFNPTTNIRFSLTEANQVTLEVYDMLGQEVATLINQFMNAGSYEIEFVASNLPTGIYTYSMTAGNFQSVKKMILIK